MDLSAFSTSFEAVWQCNGRDGDDEVRRLQICELSIIEHGSKLLSRSSGSKRFGGCPDQLLALFLIHMTGSPVYSGKTARARRRVIRGCPSKYSAHPQIVVSDGEAPRSRHHRHLAIDEQHGIVDFVLTLTQLRGKVIKFWVGV